MNDAIMTSNVFQVILAVAVLLGYTKSQIPDCKDQLQRGVFTAEPNNNVIEATGGVESVLFPCEHKLGSDVHTLWIINNKSYDSSHLPENHFYVDKVLSVKNPKLKQNDTSYQCVIEGPAAVQNTSASTCLYRSTIGYLWITCEAPKVQCSPLYYLREIEALKSITTNITKVAAVSTYIIIYSDAISGDECGSANISAISCNSGTCSHIFEVPSHHSICNSDINVTVLADNLVQSEPIMIDSHEAFVKVSFNLKIPSFTCKFIDQPKKNKKFYTIEYGPLTDGCKDLPFDIEGYLSNSNSVTLQLQFLKDEISEICFVLKAQSGSKTVIVEGVHKSAAKLLQSKDGVRSDHAAYVAATTVLICGAIIVLSLLIFSIFYMQLRFVIAHQKSQGSTMADQAVLEENAVSTILLHTESRGKMMADQTVREEIDTESQVKAKADQNVLEEIDMSTTFFELHKVEAGKDVSMKKFASKNHRYYDPRDGFGYLCTTGEQLNEIQLHKRVILMDEVKDVPKFSASNFKYSSADSKKGWGDVYVQDRGINRTLKQGTKFLYCARSKRITRTTYCKFKPVTKQCSIFEFAEGEMPGFQEIWIRYLYFQLIDQEDALLRPDQRIIVQKKDGELVTGPGVRHILGATGDCSSPIHLSKLSEHEEWEGVFIQATTTEKQLKPDTKLLFCALMEKISKKVYRYSCDVLKECKMTELVSFKAWMGYGYYEFKEKELLDLDKNIVLMHKDGSLYSGPGAKFFCIGDISFEDIGDNEISPPSLCGTDWSHVFIQSHSENQELLPGTKFLYLEYQTPYMKIDDEDDDTFRHTWSSS